MTKKKTFLEIFQIVGAILIPAAITFVGIYYSNSEKEKQIALAEIDARVKQAQLIVSMIHLLTDADTTKRYVAASTLRFAVPGESHMILNAITRRDEHLQNREKIEIQTLVSDLYASDQSVRLRAFKELSEYWSHSPEVTIQIIKTAHNSLTDPELFEDPGNGLYNSLLFILTSGGDFVENHSEKLCQLISGIPIKYQKTFQLGNAVRKKYRLCDETRNM